MRRRGNIASVILYVIHCHRRVSYNSKMGTHNIIMYSGNEHVHE